MQKLATGLQKVTPSTPAGARQHLLMELETPHDSSHPCCSVCHRKCLEKVHCIHGPSLQQTLKNVKKQSWTCLYITAVCVGMYLWNGWCAYVKQSKLYGTQSMQCHRLTPWTFHDRFSFTLKEQAGPLRFTHSWGFRRTTFDSILFLTFIRKKTKIMMLRSLRKPNYQFWSSGTAFFLSCHLSNGNLASCDFFEGYKCRKRFQDAWVCWLFFVLLTNVCSTREDIPNEVIFSTK